MHNNTERSASDLEQLSSDRMQLLLQQSRQRLAALSRNFSAHPDMQVAVHRMMNEEDILGTFSEMAVRDPDLMRVVLQASVAALVNVQTVETVNIELKRRVSSSN